jgi:hypothetical protein
LFDAIPQLVQHAYMEGAELAANLDLLVDVPS